MLVCVCACVYVFLCVCVCVRLVCMCVCVRVCLTSLEDRAWLLVEASSGPGAGGGGGAEGGGEEERGASIWRSFQSVWCLHAAMQDASTQAQHSLRREAWSGGVASCWDGSLSPFLLADLSLFFPFSQCHYCLFQNSLQITRNYIQNFTGHPRIAMAVAPANFRGTRTSFGLPLRGSPEFCYLFQAPDGLYFPDMNHHNEILPSPLCTHPCTLLRCTALAYFNYQT